MSKKIEELYAFVFDDPSNGDEGITTTFMETPIGLLNVVLVCSEKRLLESMKDVAKKVSKKEGWKIKLIKFTTREIIEQIDERN